MKTSHKRMNTRTITAAGMLAAVSTVLMAFSFSVPFMPSFIKLDLSELPALIAAFAIGPLGGVVVCLVKNLVNALSSSSGGIGEISNFLLGVCFVVPAGLIYRRLKGRKSALIGSLIGAVCMAGLSVFINYYLVYPIYTAIMPMETIIGMYQAINPNVETLWDALIWFNMPFTFFKGMLSVGICCLIYKPLSPIIKGRN